MQAKDIVRITGEAVAEAERLPNVEEIIASSAYGDPILDVKHSDARGWVRYLWREDA